MASERQKVLNDPKAIMPVSFVTFDSRWGAAVCAQTQQSKNPTQWLTDWAPEPRDVYWQNLAIPFFSLSIRRFLIYRICAITCQSWGSWKGCSISEAGNRSVRFLSLYIVSLAWCQQLRWSISWFFFTWFSCLICRNVVKSFLQGFFPGLALKIFLYILPTVLVIMSKVEGYVSLSSLERRTASKYYYFMLVNVFLGSIIAGTAFEQLYAFLHQSLCDQSRTRRNYNRMAMAYTWFFYRDRLRHYIYEDSIL